MSEKKKPREYYRMSMSNGMLELIVPTDLSERDRRKMATLFNLVIGNAPYEHED